MNTQERIFITGLGVVSPLGTGVDTYWNALSRPQSLPEVYPYINPAYMKNRLMYRIPGWTPVAEAERKNWMGRASEYAGTATETALQDADLLMKQHDSVIGVSIGSGMGNVDLFHEEREDGFCDHKQALFNFNVAADVASRFDLKGPNLSVSTACSAGAYSVSLAKDALNNGWADVMIVGGAEGFARVALACFNRLGALDPEMCRPFSAGRLGTLCGEGAAIMILESETHAQRRGAQHVYAEVKGCGWSCDGYHTTAPEPSGHQTEMAARKALEDAGLTVDDIDCIIPHGTGTELNDLMESLMLRRLFGERIADLWACAIKSHIGHGGGAAGAFSCLTGALITERGLIPPTANLTELDARCELRLHNHDSVKAEIRNVLVNAYAFGGNNISVIIGKP